MAHQFSQHPALSPPQLSSPTSHHTPVAPNQQSIATELEASSKVAYLFPKPSENQSFPAHPRAKCSRESPQPTLPAITQQIN